MRQASTRSVPDWTACRSEPRWVFARTCETSMGRANASLVLLRACHGGMLSATTGTLTASSHLYNLHVCSNNSLAGASEILLSKVCPDCTDGLRIGDTQDARRRACSIS